MPLDPYSKEMVMNLSESPVYLCHPNCPLLMRTLTSAVSGLQSQMTRNTGVAATHSAIITNTGKENNC